MIMALSKHGRRLHGENSFDLVLGVPMIPDAEAAVVIGKKLNLPVATLAIGSDVMVYTKQLPPLWKRLGSILEEVDLPVGVCEAICRRLAETGKCKRKPLCAYLGRDAEKFSPPKDKSEIRDRLGWAKEDIVAVYVGEIADTKGINELVVSAGELLGRYPNFKLVCVGGGPASERLARLKSKLGRNDAIVTPGRVAPEEVSVFLQGSDFMVFPSHSEGMPQAVLEAMNCGLPIVATRVGGIPEAVVDGDTGVLVDAHDANQLKDAMETMINDREFRISAGQKGLSYVHKVFDAERNAEKLAKALWSLVE